METRVYETRKKYVTASGETKYYANRTKYTPVNKVKKSKIIDTIRSISDVNALKEIQEFISKYEVKNE